MIVEEIILAAPFGPRAREPLELLLPPTSEQRAGSSSLQFLTGAPVKNIARRAVLGLRQGGGGGRGSSERHWTARRWRWRGLRAEAPWTEPRQLPDGSARLSPICVDSYRKRRTFVYGRTLKRGLDRKTPTARPRTRAWGAYCPHRVAPPPHAPGPCAGGRGEEGEVRERERERILRCVCIINQRPTHWKPFSHVVDT